MKERVLWADPGPGATKPSRAPLAGFAGAPDRGLTTMIWALGVAASFMLAAAFGALWYATRADLGATRENVAQLEGMLNDTDPRSEGERRTSSPG